MKMMGKIFSKRKKDIRDRGDGILVMSVFFIFMFAVIAGTAFAIVATSYNDSTYQSIAQTATDDAVRCVNTNGSLTYPGETSDDCSPSLSSGVPAAANSCTSTAQNVSTDTVNQAIASYVSQFYCGGGIKNGINSENDGCTTVPSGTTVAYPGGDYTVSTATPSPVILVTLSGDLRDEGGGNNPAPITYVSSGASETSAGLTASPPEQFSGPTPATTNLYQTVTMTVIDTGATTSFIFSGCHTYVMTKSATTFASETDATLP